jgi:hypothetical protein
VNITGGSIAGDIVGSGTGTLNFNLGAASTYTDTNKFVDLSQVNVDNGTTLVLNSTATAPAPCRSALVARCPAPAPSRPR